MSFGKTLAHALLPVANSFRGPDGTVMKGSSVEAAPRPRAKQERLQRPPNSTGCTLPIGAKAGAARRAAPSRRRSTRRCRVRKPKFRYGCLRRKNGSESPFGLCSQKRCVDVQPPPARGCARYAYSDGRRDLAGLDHRVPSIDRHVELGCACFTRDVGWWTMWGKGRGRSSIAEESPAGS